MAVTVHLINLCFKRSAKEMVFFFLESAGKVETKSLSAPWKNY